MGRIVLILFLGFIVICATAMILGNLPGAQQETRKDPCELNAFTYLLAIQEGNSIASAFWKPGVTPQTLFAVHKFDWIKYGPWIQPNGKPYKVPRVYYEYEIESSTKGGFPIRKRWNIVMEPSSKDFGGQPCPIVDLAEAE